MTLFGQTKGCAKGVAKKREPTSKEYSTAHQRQVRNEILEELRTWEQKEKTSRIKLTWQRGLVSYLSVRKDGKRSFGWRKSGRQKKKELRFFIKQRASEVTQRLMAP